MQNILQNTAIMQTEPELNIQGLGRLRINGLPLLKIAQTSTQMENTNISLGDIYNQVTLESYGKEIDLIAYYRFSRRTKYPQRGNGTYVECFSPDNFHGRLGRECEKCTKRRTLENYQEKDQCTDQNVFVVTQPDHLDWWMLLPFMRSNFSAGKKLEKLLKISCVRHSIPIFGQKIKLITRLIDHEATGTSQFAFDAQLSDQITCEETLERLRKNQILIEASLQQEQAEFVASNRSAKPTEENGDGIFVNAWQTLGLTTSGFNSGKELKESVEFNG